VDALGNRTRERITTPNNSMKERLMLHTFPVTISTPAIEEALKEKAFEVAGGA
jgi:hypothetical protein